MNKQASPQALMESPHSTRKTTTAHWIVVVFTIINPRSGGVNAPIGKVCIFQNQCKLCKSSDDQCVIMFTYMTSSYRYEVTYYSNRPGKPDIKACYIDLKGAIKCENQAKLPDYIPNNQS